MSDALDRVTVRTERSPQPAPGATPIVHRNAPAPHELPPFLLNGRAEKDTNPKEAVGDTKVALALLSPIAKIKWAMAQFAGMLKYGAWNWRAAGVRHSTYISAIDRHLDGIKSGETFDPVDGTDHYGNIMACCAIVIEARAAGKLNDDRGPALDHRAAIAEAEELMVKLKAQYAGKTPKHWVIGDRT